VPASAAATPTAGVAGTAVSCQDFRISSGHHAVPAPSTSPASKTTHSKEAQPDDAATRSGLWSGSPASIKLDDLDVICAVVGCGVEELLIAEPAVLARPAGGQPGQQAAAPSQAGPGVTPRRRDGRSLPPA